MGLAVRIAMSGVGFGIPILIPLMGEAITRYRWRNAYLILAAPALLVAIIVASLLAFKAKQRPTTASVGSRWVAALS
jgi:ABC-type microcin C transport system permease subunit YejE